MGIILEVTYLTTGAAKKLYNVSPNDYIICRSTERKPAMKRWLRKLRTRRLQRQQRALERWEKQRAQGKWRFVLHTTLTYVALMVIASDVLEYLFYGRTRATTFSPWTIFFFLTGLLIMSDKWETMEDKYRFARINNRTVPANIGPRPHDRSLRGKA